MPSTVLDSTVPRATQDALDIRGFLYMDVRERPAANVDAMTSLWDSSDYVFNSNSDFVCYRASGISRDRANAAMAIGGTG